jgi:Domain of unknown function (DUF4258)
MSSPKKSKLGSLLILGILLLLYFLLFRKSDVEAPIKYTRRDHREVAFRHQRIYYTKHARCRMECRNIDESEVKEILKEGEINYSKSDMKSTPCPKYAVEGTTHDGQEVRIIVGNCDSQASIVTVIDLKNEAHCDCK